MDGTVIGLFLFAAFLGGLTSGAAGFAMGIVVSSMWLHILTPVQNAVLIVGYGFVTQGYAIWKLRYALSWRKVAPFIVGSGIGVPIGTMLLTHYGNPASLRQEFGLLLVVYSTYSLVRPTFKPVPAGVAADSGIGVLNGVLGGLTGLTGIVVTIWCQLRGWPKDEQRAVFQPVNFATIVMSAVSLSVAGSVTAETVRLYLIGLPLMLSGLWLGFRLYGRFEEAAFRKLILILLFISGSALLVRPVDVSMIVHLFRQ